MPDVAAYRAKLGAIVPSTNTMVEHDFALLRPHGVTLHAGRAMIHRPQMGDDASAKALLDQMDASFDDAVASVMTAEPDRVVIAMSAEVIRRGVEGGRAFVDQLEQRIGVPVTSAPDAVVQGLRALGATRVGMVTPYHPESDALTATYFRESGFEIVALRGLRAPSATGIAKFDARTVAEAVREVHSSSVHALVQVGTNLSAVRLAAQAEDWLGTPMIAMNAATMWWAMRESGFDDRWAEYGVLLRDH